MLRARRATRSAAAARWCCASAMPPARAASPISQWVDRIVRRIRGHRAPPHLRPAARRMDRAAAAASASRCRERPMREGTPFANVLLVATVAPPRSARLSTGARSTAPASRRWCRTAARCACSTVLALGRGAIHCLAVDHRDPAHPLRSRGGLLAGAAIEYAAQAMALHGGLLARPPAPARRPAISRARATCGSRAGGSTTCRRRADDPAHRRRAAGRRRRADALRLRVEHAAREIARAAPPSSSTRRRP